MPTALSVISTANDIAALLPVTNGTVTIGPDTLPGSFLSDILNTFNNGQPLQISTSTIPAVLSNGVTVSGTTPFFGATSVQLSATFYVSGDFTLTATLPDLTLTQLTSKVSALQLPDGMANADLGEAQITAGHTGGVSSFTAVGGSPTLGEFAFSAQKSGSTWGAAFGFEINVQGICNVPALKNTALANFDSFLGLQNFVMVLSSFDSPGFTFPDLVSFDASGLVPCGKIALPGTGGIKAGLNLFASLGGGSATGAVAKLIHGFNLGSLSTALSVSLPDPLTSSQLYFNLANIAIRKGVLLNGSFGGRLQASSVGVYFLGTVQASIQHQQVTFTAQAIAAPTGFMLSGSMQTTAGLNFDVGNTKFSISDLGFVIGVDDDGLPSLGFAATFDIGTAEVSAAVFIDSVTPSQSVFAASVSSFTLYDIATCIAGQKSSDLASIKTILSSFALKGTQSFSLPGNLSTALNTRDLKTIANAFQTSAQAIALPSTYDKVQVHVNTAGLGRRGGGVAGGRPPMPQEIHWKLNRELVPPASPRQITYEPTTFQA